MLRKIASLVGFLVLVSCNGPARLEEGIRDVYDDLAPKTSVPIRLPTNLHDNETVDLAMASRDEYAVEYFPASCGTCHLGFIQGVRLNSDDPDQVGDRVDLHGGIKGYYYPEECDTTCDDAELRWIQDGVVYTVSRVEGNLVDLEPMANSAIDNGSLNSYGSSDSSGSSSSSDSSDSSSSQSHSSRITDLKTSDSKDGTDMKTFTSNDSVYVTAEVDVGDVKPAFHWATDAVRVEGVSPNSHVSSLDLTEESSSEVSVNSSETGTYHLTPPAAGWPSGDYRVVLNLADNGKTVDRRTVDFTIQR